MSRASHIKFIDLLIGLLALRKWGGGDGVEGGGQGCNFL